MTVELSVRRWWGSWSWEDGKALLQPPVSTSRIQENIYLFPHSDCSFLKLCESPKQRAAPHNSGPSPLLGTVREIRACKRLSIKWCTEISGRDLKCISISILCRKLCINFCSGNTMGEGHQPSLAGDAAPPLRRDAWWGAATLHALAGEDKIEK